MSLFMSKCHIVGNHMSWLISCCLHLQYLDRITSFSAGGVKLELVRVQSWAGHCHISITQSLYVFNCSKCRSFRFHYHLCLYMP